MSKIKVKAVVLSSRSHKENDRIIRILSPELGVFSACVPGAGKVNSKHGFSTRPGMLSEFVMSKSKGFYYIAESDLIYSFQGIEQSIEQLTALAHILEISQDTAMDSAAVKLIYELLVYTMHALSQNKDYRLVVSAFEWRIMDIVGFSVPIDDNIQQSECVFSFDSCCFYPKESKQRGRTVILCKGCIHALMHIQKSTLDQLFSFSASDTVCESLSKFTRQYLCERLDSKYCKLDLLHSAYSFNSDK